MENEKSRESQLTELMNSTKIIQQTNYQVDISSTNFDIETIVSSYTGLLRIYRLLYIADHCETLRSESFLQILKLLENTHLISLYTKIIDELQSQHVSLPSELDPNWKEKTQRSFVQKLDKLDTDLRNYRTNSIKDSIRRGHDELGDHYLDSGHFYNALRCYVRARDYCASPQHIVKLCFNVIKASMLSENWTNVFSYVDRAEQALESLESSKRTKEVAVQILMDSSTRNSADVSVPVITSRLKAYAGIAELATKRYKLAARSLLTIPFDHCIHHLQDIISPQTLIQYVCLCALSSYDRSEINRFILKSNNTKEYLELEPTIKEILTTFHRASYSTCLVLLKNMEPIFALDCYLGFQLESLYSDIRRRMIVTYFLPYRTVTMVKMAADLNTTIELLEDELVQLIRSGQLQARIDSKNKILQVTDTDPRWIAYQHALQVTEEMKKLTQSILLRTAIIRQNFLVTDGTKYDSSLFHSSQSKSSMFNSNTMSFRNQHSFDETPMY